MDSSKKVAVIGAGISGLASIKACKEENIQVTCYEITKDIGGLWKYRDEDIPYVASVSKSTVMNSSKEMSVFSDLPPPAEFPVFMPHADFYKYIRLYAEKHSLTSHVRFGKRVTLVKETEDFDSTGKWKVVAKVIDTNVEEEDVYDAIMVCTGSYSKPFYPSFPGRETFQGDVLHSHHYKEPSKFKDKRVLIVGTGNSAADVAVDVCGVASLVYMSSRKGARLISRIGPGGQPFDAAAASRINNLAFQYLPRFITNTIMERMLQERLNSSHFNLSLEKRLLRIIPTVNDLLPFHLINGRIKIKRAIRRFTSGGVVFEGEDHVTPFDVIVFGTGYEIEFPFLQKPVHPSDLYLNIVRPDCKHPTMAFIGFIEVVKGLTPIIEKQSVWYVQLFLGKIQLPARQEMLNWISNYKQVRIEIYGKGNKIFVTETYEDELAEKLGVKPDLLRMLWNDPKLFYACLMGPILPYQYRLQGPRPWEGAREAIVNYEKRLFNV
ncbi:flavin-containing monooxygenase 5-like [Centruroides vittatus]|uniref:flavin-containing monooxygenase 5-like n=1 Tax=Centruroides vittatus TaxID=120091 RepID=UPI00350ECCF9